VPGLVVLLTSYDDDRVQYLDLKARTDAQGRYEIHGAHKSKRYLVQIASDPAAGTMASELWADDTAGYQPVRADLKVKKGVIVTGKVIDGATGEALPGWAMAAALDGNPFARDYPKITMTTTDLMQFVAHSKEMDADGTFRLVTLPGPVLLMGGPDHRKPVGGPLGALQYQPAHPDPKYPQYFQAGSSDPLFFKPLGVFHSPVEGNFCKVLEIKPGTALVKQDIVLERARALTVSIQDPEGRPLAGAWVTGISPRSDYRAMRIEKSSCPAYHLEPGKPRLLVFCEPMRKLAGTLTVTGTEKQPVVVKLGPAPKVHGRLLDAEGRPLAGIAVDVRYQERQAQEVHDALHEGTTVATDADGFFTLDTLLPGLRLQLSFHRGGQRFQQATQHAAATFQLRAYECRDLGTLTLKRANERAGK
jgi:hypothetical protein